MNNILEGASTNAKLILIVDDEPDIAMTYSMLFQYHGFEVLTATNGMEAINIVAQRVPDVILSDYMMPLMNGVELCSEIKKNPQLANTLFLLTSAFFRPQDITGPYDLFMQKPVAFPKLLEEIKRLLIERGV